MFSLSNWCRNKQIFNYLVLQAGYKSKVHWSKLKKKTGPKHKALEHFDEFYASVFGDKWEPMKEALLRRSKYVAVINNYGDAEETMEHFSNRGAHCLKNLMSIQKEFHNKYSPISVDESPQTQSDRVQDFATRLQADEITRLYPQDAPERLDVKDMTLGEAKVEKSKEVLPNKSLEQSLAEAEIDTSRIIDPSMGISSDVLYQYIPATKLKGMDDWVPESLHYSYYSKEQSFPLVMEQETQFEFPEHLKVFTYEMDSEWETFPEPKRGQTGVYNYYPMDCGSVLAVLALCLSPGNRVLDMCSAPGGKALVALQTLLPDIVICNDTSISRSNRTKRTFRDYLYDFETSNKWRERVLFTKVDGRVFADDQGFDKILVDVPCTTDRVSVTENENNIFRADRIKERLKIPEMQAGLLMNALKLVKVGGAVVYSTCSLSPIQNDGVVHLALKQAFEQHSIIASIRDLTPSMSALSTTLKLGTDAAAPKYGQLVTPSIGANFGPSYIARLVRLK